MQTDYVPAQEAMRKLQFAHGIKTAVYLYGATGYGKTALVRHFLGQSKALWLNARDEEWNLEPLQKSGRKTPLCVVIDDLHFLAVDAQRAQILELARREDVWLILIGRCAPPNWLMPLMADCQLTIIPEEALHLSDREIISLASGKGLTLTEEELECLHAAKGNGYAIHTTLQYMVSGQPLDESLNRKISGIFEDYLENQIISQWSFPLQEFLMMVSVVDTFTLSMAETITGDDQSAAMIDQALSAGNFLMEAKGVYALRPELLNALRSRAQKVIGANKVRQCADRAGLYYEMHSDVIRALQMYERSGNNANIRNLLIRNGRRHPGMGYHFALRRYYLTLSQEEIETSAILMSTMSLLYSMLMNEEKSEYWYNRLRERVTDLKGGEKAEAQARLLWLDIVLPHRGSKDLLDIIKRVVSVTLSGAALPEISVTSNLPSTMNGGKDFCHWSKYDRVIAESIGKPLEKLLGSHGRGLVNLALAESLYEKAEKDYEVFSRITRGQMEAEGSGTMELIFAAVGLQCRLSMLRGNSANARQLLDGFEKRAAAEGAVQFIPNLHALRCRTALMMGITAEMDAWMEEAPDETVEFCAMDRYRYLTKIRVYLRRNDTERALSLLERLAYYAEYSNRPYIRIETSLLKAIALERQAEDWKPVLLSALEQAQEYRLVRIICEEGAAVLPLLKKIRSTCLGSGNANAAWFDLVEKETEAIAQRYPAYLGTQQADRSDFTDTALSVLQLQAEGKSGRQIAQELYITERTVKYHAAENYRKLGVKNKTAAVEKARKLNLI